MCLSAVLSTFYYISLHEKFPQNKGKIEIAPSLPRRTILWGWNQSGNPICEFLILEVGISDHLIRAVPARWEVAQDRRELLEMCIF